MKIVGIYADLLLYFTFYAFSGWLLGTVFAAICQGKFINRGFLNGFFCPLYGFSAVLIILSADWADAAFGTNTTSLFISILLAVILVTALEYATGFVLEKIFHCKWWDYKNNFANIHGYICLQYSLLWGLLALLLLRVVHPVIARAVFVFPAPVKGYAAALLCLYFLVDTTKSVIDALDLREVIFNYANFPVEK